MSEEIAAPLHADAPAELSRSGRFLVLFAAFTGWMFAGLEMGTFPLLARSATSDFFASSSEDPVGDSAQEKSAEGQVGKWFAWYTCAFLMGAATGGLVFGWFGDRAGRVKSMGLSILWYSGWTGASYFAQSLEQLLFLRFLASMGIGGMWPTGVSLTSEAWPDVSRPMLAGLIGTAANVGIVSIAFIARLRAITPEDWRWVMLVGAAPIFLGFLVLALVPESPGWLAERNREKISGTRTPVSDVFTPPLLKLTIIGICLGTIPLLGGWGSGNWLIPWAGQVYQETDPTFKGWTMMSRSGGAVLGSLIGGWLASLLGRRITYFVISLGSLSISGYIFWKLTPESSEFLTWVFLLGFVSTVFFGWLPLYLPELFPTYARATGSGVTFNFGRIVSTAGVLGASALIVYYQGDYGRVGRVTSLIYALGMIVILFAPDTSGKQLHTEAKPAGLPRQV